MFRFIQNVRMPSKPIFMAVILLFLFAVLFCDHAQVLAHMSAQKISDCVFLASYLTPSRGDSVLYMNAFILLAALAAATRLQMMQGKHESKFFYSWESSLLIRTTQFVAKLYNPLFRALHKGILHTQIYSTVSIVG